MTKKDRIAIVISIVMLGIGTPMALSNNDAGIYLGTLVLVAMFGYWAYRFIKNDISFLKMRD